MMRLSTRCLFSLFLSLSLSLSVAHTAQEWKSRNIYQLLTDRFNKPDNSTAPCANIRNYCGGTFQGIINRLDYIQSLGFDSVWISPVVANSRGGFHGYWMTDIYTINPYFGTADDLKALSRALHDRGMWLMVDVVANHMAAVSINNLTSLVPFNQAIHYHDCNGCDPQCNINQWNPPNATQLEHCRLSGLLDLDQDNKYVRATLSSWIHDLVQNYSIDGLRIDTFPHVKCEYWKEFLVAAGVYAVGEVASGDITWVAPWQKCGDATLSYPLYYTMRNVFAQKQSMKQLGELYQQSIVQFTDISVLGVFNENHDQPRFLSQNKDAALFRSSLAYTLTSIGISIIYYGAEQGFNGPTDPNDREPLWTSGFSTSGPYFLFISTLNRYRAAAQLGVQTQQVVLAEDNAFAFVRGNSTLVVLTQQGSTSGFMSVHVPKVPFAAGTQLHSVLTNSVFTVGRDSYVSVQLVNGDPLVLTTISQWANLFSSQRKVLAVAA